MCVAQWRRKNNVVNGNIQHDYIICADSFDVNHAMFQVPFMTLIIAWSRKIDLKSTSFVKIKNFKIPTIGASRPGSFPTSMQLGSSHVPVGCRLVSFHHSLLSLAKRPLNIYVTFGYSDWMILLLRQSDTSFATQIPRTEPNEWVKNFSRATSVDKGK